MAKKGTRRKAAPTLNTESGPPGGSVPAQVDTQSNETPTPGRLIAAWNTGRLFNELHFRMQQGWFIGGCDIELRNKIKQLWADLAVSVRKLCLTAQDAERISEGIDKACEDWLNGMGAEWHVEEMNAIFDESRSPIHPDDEARICRDFLTPVDRNFEKWKEEIEKYLNQNEIRIFHLAIATDNGIHPRGDFTQFFPHKGETQRQWGNAPEPLMRPLEAESQSGLAEEGRPDSESQSAQDAFVTAPPDWIEKSCRPLGTAWLTDIRGRCAESEILDGFGGISQAENVDTCKFVAALDQAIRRTLVNRDLGGQVDSNASPNLTADIQLNVDAATQGIATRKKRGRKRASPEELNYYRLKPVG